MTRFRILAGALAALLASAPAVLPAQTLRPQLQSSGVLRVCADPDNLPFSNQKGEGYENKIAELIAETWHSRVEYAWWPIRRGFFARALNGRYCDVALTAPTGLDMVAVTHPYYRSAYAIVYRKDSGLHITSLDDPALKKLRIGVNLLDSDAENTPPAMALSYHGVVGTLVGFGTFYSDSGARPEDIINAVVKRDIDLAIVWGPMAGYYVKRAPVPLEVNLVQSDSTSGIPFAFSMSVGVRRRDRDLRDSLQVVLDEKRPQIEAILREYGVPMLPLATDSSKGAAAKPASR